MYSDSGCVCALFGVCRATFEGFVVGVLCAFDIKLALVCLKHAISGARDERLSCRESGESRDM